MIYLNDEILSFKNFYEKNVQESNYESLEKDPRIEDISDKLKDEIIFTLKTNFFESGISGKLKFDDQYQIIYKIFFYESRDDIRIFKSAEVDRNNNSFILNLYFNKQYGFSLKHFYNELLKFIKEEYQFILFHEVKHILNDIDNLYTKSKYYLPTLDNLKSEKYQSQKGEFEHFILSIQGELIFLSKKYPNKSLNEILPELKLYKTIKAMPKRKYNKLMSKVTDFWQKKLKRELI